MRHTIYLVFDRKRITRTAVNHPNLHAGEFAIRVNLDVPDTLFKEQLPTATIEVPERMVYEPVLTVEQPEQPIAEDAE